MINMLGGRFGTISKAAFAVGIKQKDNGEWEFEDPVEVLLNPSTLKVSMSTQIKKDEGVANEETPSTSAADGKITPKGITEQQVEMTLIFNVVEEYNAKTQGAEFKALVTAAKSVVSTLISGANLGDTAEDTLTDLINKTDFTNLSLLNKDLCCYTPLLEAARKQLPVLFFWGNMFYAGLITKFQTTFNYFSNQGAPLGAEVALSMISAVSEKQLSKSVSSMMLEGILKGEDGGISRQLPGL